MDDIFNEQNYRNYLETYYVHDIDKNNLEKKMMIDKYSIEYLQKIVVDTKIFSNYAIGELKEGKNNLIDYVYMKVELLEEGRIDSNLHGGWSADTLYKPAGFDDNFWISRYLLEHFFKTYVDINYEEYEYYNEIENAGTILYTPYIYISMSKEQFEKYDNFRFDNQIKIKKL